MVKFWHLPHSQEAGKGKGKPKGMDTANCLEKSLAPWPYWLRVTSNL